MQNNFPYSILPNITANLIFLTFTFIFSTRNVNEKDEKLWQYILYTFNMICILCIHFEYVACEFCVKHAFQSKNVGTFLLEHHYTETVNYIVS
jgi:hypothetical protein